MLGRLLDPGLSLAGEGSYVLPARRRAVVAAAAICAGFAYVWLFLAWTATAQWLALPPAEVVAAPAALLVTATAALLVAGPGGTASAALLIGGLVATHLLWSDPGRALTMPAVVCLAGLLLSRRAAVLAALALSAQAEPRLLIALWATAGAVWLSAHWVQAAMREAAERQRSATRLEQELLTRREELRRLNDSLRNAYTLLERTNHELAEARDEAEAAQRLKTQFTASISHELRTPLNLILGFTEVMYRTPESYPGAAFTPDLVGDLREVYRATAHLLDLVDDVLDLSRVAQVRLAVVPEETDLLELIGEATATVAGLFRGKPVELKLELPPSLPRCTVDRTRIRQTMINLLANAARFTEQGRVRVAAKYDADRDEVVVSVSDTGSGISAEDQAHLFDAFYQVASPLRQHRGGTGLGLAICRTFVQMHGGRIWVQSEVGRGSRFYFALPVRFRDRPAQEEWRLPGATDPFGDSLVTLDRDGSLAHLLQRAMPSVTVRNAATPEAAAHLVAEWHPRAVIAFERDGEHSEAERLRQSLHWPGLPLVSCRLSPRRPLRRHGNVQGVLRKPVTGKQLVAALASLGKVGSVLVADDDAGMIRLVQRTLAGHYPNVRLLTAENGTQALEVLRRERVDAVLLDMAMPECDGPGVLQAMEAGGLGQVPVLALTAMDMEGPADELASWDIALAAPLGFGGSEVLGYLEALVQAARPRYGSGAAAAA